MALHRLGPVLFKLAQMLQIRSVKESSTNSARLSFLWDLHGVENSRQCTYSFTNSCPQSIHVKMHYHERSFRNPSTDLRATEILQVSLVIYVSWSWLVTQSRLLAYSRLGISLHRYKWCIILIPKALVHCLSIYACALGPVAVRPVRIFQAMHSCLWYNYNIHCPSCTVLTIYVGLAQARPNYLQTKLTN